MLGRFLLHLRRQYAGFLALFIVLGGSAYAVGTGSIDSREIRNNTVRSKDIRNNDVRSADVRNGSLGRRDFKRLEIPTGSRGPVGPTGPPGPPGTAGAPGATRVVMRENTTGPFTGRTGGAVDCAAGERAVGGGIQIMDAAGPGDAIQQTAPYGNGSTVPTAWTGSAYISGPAKRIRIEVVCASP